MSEFNIAWPQKEMSRDVSQASSPTLDLSHCRSLSINDTRHVFLHQTPALQVVLFGQSGLQVVYLKENHGAAIKVGLFRHLDNLVHSKHSPITAFN